MKLAISIILGDSELQARYFRDVVDKDQHKHNMFLTSRHHIYLILINLD